MRYSGIGGQAVIEGVMMRNRDKYALAVRLPNNEIKVDVHQEKTDVEKYAKIPVVRGIVSFIHSLTIGLGSLSKAASYFDEEEGEKKELTEEEKKKKEKKDKAEMGGTLLLSFVLALAVFMVLPYYLSTLFSKIIPSESVVILIEGIIRVLIFLAYVILISQMEDIKRVFMYHGAEHKCINYIESGLELNVENVRKSSRQHKRCGTSFLFVVLIISVLVFMFIRMDSHILRVLCRLLLVPLIAGISYEFIRLAGRTENPIINALSYPGLLVQKITTREPDDSMIEVGIASVEAVFDWKKFQEEDKDSDCEFTG
ncbi:MAG: DUF1385 domain-containing protein [Lachnospiraceae bacterium]|nr:DUF1385 domain-containing protein [Lachnospiraceae bacterium]